MFKQATRAAALAAAAVIAVAAPVWAQITIPGMRAPVVEQPVTSNRLATAKMYLELTDAAHALRTKVAAQDWAASGASVQALRARIDLMKDAAVVDPQARLLIAELRPHAVAIERDLMARKAVSVRTVDLLIAQVERTNAELLQAGYMDKIGGGAGRGVVPQQPEIRVYPPGANVESLPSLPAENNKNKIDEWRGDDQD